MNTAGLRMIYALSSSLLAISAVGTSGVSLGCELHAQAALVAQADVHSGHSGHMDHSMHSMEAGDSLKDKSIYHASGGWTAQDGKKFELSDLRGKAVVVAMAYTRCQYVCPRIVADMKMIQSKLPDKKKTDVRFVFVSLDSKNDTPDKLKEYAAKHKLDLATWTLIHGDEDSVLEVAALLGVKYKKENNGADFAHSYIITLLDKDGVIRAQRLGAGEPKEKILDPLLKM